MDFAGVRASVPRDPDTGLTIRTLGKLGDKNPPTIDGAAPWLQHPAPASCALDLADRGKLDNTELGVELRRHRTLIAKLVIRAIASAKAKGLESADIVRLIEPDRRLDQEPTLVRIRRRP